MATVRPRGGHSSTAENAFYFDLNKSTSKLCVASSCDLPILAENAKNYNRLYSLVMFEVCYCEDLLLHRGRSHGYCN